MRAPITLAATFVMTVPAFAQSGSAVAVETGIGLLLIGLLIPIFVGAIVGWLASLIVKGSGSGLFVDILIGIGGSMIASHLLPLLGVPIGGGFVSAFIAAVAGAVILLLVIKLIRRI